MPLFLQQYVLIILLLSNIKYFNKWDVQSAQAALCCHGLKTNWIDIIQLFFMFSHEANINSKV